MLMAPFLLFRIMKEPCVCQRCHIYLPKSMRLLTLSSNGQTVTICFVSALLFFLLCFDFPPFLHAKFFFSSSSIHPQHQHLHFLDVSIKASDRCFDILNALLNMYLALFPSTLMVRHVESRRRGEAGVRLRELTGRLYWICYGCIKYTECQNTSISFHDHLMKLATPDVAEQTCA